MDPQELVPLEGVISLPPRPKRQFHLPARTCHRGPVRVLKLLLLLVVIPATFILLPVYLRYRVYSGQMYPMSMTDMRLIDSKVSPTWCQRVLVRSNATFNAFVVPSPELSTELLPVSMSRELLLEDDMKEYWGFYLLKGSSVTVSACVRYPGASLIMIKGYKHLQECAYIGDDSSEELDELTEAYELGLLSGDLYKQKYMEKKAELKKEDGKANKPGKMARQSAGVSFHARSGAGAEQVPPAGDVDHDPTDLTAILEHLHSLRSAAKLAARAHYAPPAHLVPLPALHRHRDANVDREERQFLSFKDIDGNTSQQEVLPPRRIDPKTYFLNHSVNDLQKHGHISIVTKVMNINDNYLAKSVAKDDTKKEIINSKDSVNVKKDLATLETKLEVQMNNVTKKTDRVNETITKEDENLSTVEEPNSKEVFEDVLKRLQALGDRGKRVLLKLEKTMGVDNDSAFTTTSIPDKIMSSLSGTSEELDHLRQVLVEAIDEEKTRKQRQEKRRTAREAAFAQKEKMKSAIELTRELNEDDEERNFAQEEQDFEADGYADDHQTVNETSPYDMSNSEFWSSFSSSEEALLECAGLVLNLPLTPHPKCVKIGSDEQKLHAARANALTYRVPANGYYFFVFNSENEVQQNFIYAKFDLQKTRYEVAKTALRDCVNTTEKCDLPLDMFSSQKVVLEIPLRDNDSLWNEQFVLLSECEPRTSIYLFCVIAVPILIVVFGFQ